MSFWVSFEILDNHQCHHVVAVLLVGLDVAVIDDPVGHDRDNDDDDHAIYFFGLYDLFVCLCCVNDFFYDPPIILR